MDDLIILEAKDVIAFGFKIGLSNQIIFFDHPILVDVAVQLDDEAIFVTVEIGDIGADDVLGSEFCAGKVAVAK